MSERTLGTVTSGVTTVALLLVLAAPLAAADTGTDPSQSSESHAASAVIGEQTGTLGDASLQAQPVATLGLSPSSAPNPVTTAEVAHLFNELRRELLDDRAKTIDWWLAIIAIILVVAGLLGYTLLLHVEDARSSRKAGICRSSVCEGIAG